MNPAPDPSTYGQTTTFHRKLYEELLDLGYSHVNLFKLSLSEALLARYGSAEAVDQELGEDTYRGVRQKDGGLSNWRKPWSRVRKEQKARYLIQSKALDTLMDAVDQCMEAGVMDADILSSVQKMLNAPARVVTFDPPQQLPQAQ